MPLRYRHAYAAGLQRGLPTGDINRRRSSPHNAGAHRNPAPIRQVRAGGVRLRGVQTLVSHVHLPVTLAGPRPSDGAGPSRRRRGCFPPFTHVPGLRLPPASPTRCDGLAAMPLQHRTVRERLRGAPSGSCTFGPGHPSARAGPGSRRREPDAPRSRSGPTRCTYGALPSRSSIRTRAICGHC